MNRFCKHCGKDISNRHKNADYCDVCAPIRHQFKRERWKQINLKSGQYTCQTCGKVLNPPSRQYIPKQCKECYLKNMPKREKSPTWKGGRIKVNGYIYVPCEPTHLWARKHSKRGLTYAPEHVINWEKYCGKQLPKEWVIHHLNGITDDNSPFNLIAMPRSKHSGHTRIEALQKRIRELEATIS